MALAATMARLLVYQAAGRPCVRVVYGGADRGLSNTVLESNRAVAQALFAMAATIFVAKHVIERFILLQRKGQYVRSTSFDYRHSSTVFVCIAFCG